MSSTRASRPDPDRDGRPPIDPPAPPPVPEFIAAISARTPVGRSDGRCEVLAVYAAFVFDDPYGNRSSPLMSTKCLDVSELIRFVDPTSGRIRHEALIAPADAPPGSEPIAGHPDLFVGRDQPGFMYYVNRSAYSIDGTKHASELEEKPMPGRRALFAQAR